MLWDTFGTSGTYPVVSNVYWYQIHVGPSTFPILKSLGFMDGIRSQQQKNDIPNN